MGRPIPQDPPSLTDPQESPISPLGPSTLSSPSSGPPLIPHSRLRSTSPPPPVPRVQLPFTHTFTASASASAPTPTSATSASSPNLSGFNSSSTPQAGLHSTDIPSDIPRSSPLQVLFPSASFSRRLPQSHSPSPPAIATAGDSSAIPTPAIVENDVERLRNSVRRYREEIERIGAGGASGGSAPREGIEREGEGEAEGLREEEGRAAVRPDGLQRFSGRDRQREARARLLNAEGRQGSLALGTRGGGAVTSEEVGRTGSATMPNGQVEMERVLRAARQALSTAVAFAERLEQVTTSLSTLTEARATLLQRQRAALDSYSSPSSSFSLALWDTDSSPSSSSPLTHFGSPSSSIEVDRPLRPFPSTALINLERSITSLRAAGSRIDTLLREMGQSNEPPAPEREREISPEEQRNRFYQRQREEVRRRARAAEEEEEREEMAMMGRVAGRLQENAGGGAAFEGDEDGRSEDVMDGFDFEAVFNAADAMAMGNHTPFSRSSVDNQQQSLRPSPNLQERLRRAHLPSPSSSSSVPSSSPPSGVAATNPIAPFSPPSTSTLPLPPAPAPNLIPLPSPERGNRQSGTTSSPSGPYMTRGSRFMHPETSGAGRTSTAPSPRPFVSRLTRFASSSSSDSTTQLPTTIGPTLAPLASPSSAPTNSALPRPAPRFISRLPSSSPSSTTSNPSLSTRHPLTTPTSNLAPSTDLSAPLAPASAPRFISRLPPSSSFSPTTSTGSRIHIATSESDSSGPVPVRVDPSFRRAMADARRMQDFVRFTEQDGGIGGLGVEVRTRVVPVRPEEEEEEEEEETEEDEILISTGATERPLRRRPRVPSSSPPRSPPAPQAQPLVWRPHTRGFQSQQQQQQQGSLRRMGWPIKLDRDGVEIREERDGEESIGSGRGEGQGEGERWKGGRCGR